MDPLPQPIPIPEALDPAVPGVARPGALLPRVARVRGWVKILSAYFTTQTLTQLAGIGAGLLFINFMPVREFALYTLAFSVITFFTFLSDLGSTSSLLHFFRQSGGPAGKAEGGDFGDFGGYFAAVLSLRRGAFLLGAVVVAAIFPVVAHAKGFTLAESLPATAAIALCVWFQINSSLRVLALRLNNRYGQSYRAEIAGGLTRLAAAAAIVVSGILRAWLGVLTSAVSAGLTTLLARDPTAPWELHAEARRDLRPYRRKVLRYLLPTLPSAFYFSIQGPLVIWLSATFGSTETIAEVGALGRLSLVVGLFSSLTGVVFLPRLARIDDDRRYLVRYLQCFAFLALVVLALLAAAALFPQAFLFVLGPKYHGLHRELFLLVLSSGLALLDGYAVGINTARSWNRWQAAALVVLFAAQATAIALLPMSSTWNVLLFNVFTAAVALLAQVTINLFGFVRPRWVHWV
jgi:O-antigen/teichoic acid export membrane protein